MREIQGILIVIVVVKKVIVINYGDGMELEVLLLKMEDLNKKHFCI